LGTVTEIDNKLEDMQEQEDEEKAITNNSAANETSQSSDTPDDTIGSSGDPAMDASFMSESIYEKLPTPSPRSLRHRSNRTYSDARFCGCFATDLFF